MKRLIHMHMYPKVILLLSLLFLIGCNGIVSSKQMTTISTFTEPTQANAYYFLPMVKIHLIVDGSIEKGNTECNLKLKEILKEPDPRYFFSLIHLTNIFADDHVVVTIDKNGLLSKVETTSEGKSGKIVLQLAELAKEAMKISAFPMLKGKAAEKEEFQYEAIIDPTDTKAVEAFNKYLDGHACNLLVEVQAPENALFAENQNKPSGIVREGIFYRPALPYTIIFMSKDESAANKSIRTVQTVYVPNAAPVFTFDIKRPSFVKYTQTVEFDSGMLKSSSITKPSEALGFISIPVDLAKTIVSIPGELFKFRTDNVKGETALLEAQQKLLEAQIKLMEKEDELRRAQEGY